MISVDAIGCNYVHTKGWEINRPEGLNNYLFLHIQTPSDIMVDGKMVYYPEPCFILFKKWQRQLFHNHEDMTYIDSWVHFRSVSESGSDIIRKDGHNDAARTDDINSGSHNSSNNSAARTIRDWNAKDDNNEKDEIEILIESLDIPCGKPVIIYNTIELSDLWHLADAEFHQAGSHKKELLDMKMRALIYKFADIMHSESGTPSKYNHYRKAFGELRNSIFCGNNAATINDVENLAKGQNMSLSYFEHVYKELFHVPVTKDIIKARIGYARYLLRSSGNSVQDIASYCGYENIEHFNRQFKATVGCTPTQFRNR